LISLDLIRALVGMQRIALLGAVLLLFANTACAASFDCSKAGTKVEKMICADPELSKLDEELDRKYQTALQGPWETSSRYKSEHDFTWLKKRNRCPDSKCLKYVYHQFLTYLDNPNPKAEFGFDCKKASTSFEKYACDPQANRWMLAKADNELNTVYRDALTRYFDPDLLRKSQRAWLKARDRCVKDIHCNVLNLYEDRIYDLRYDMAHPPQTKEEKDNARLLSMALPMGDNFHIAYQPDFEGYGTGICEAMVRWMNHTTPKGNIPFGPSPAFSLPGLTGPTWQEIDIHQYKELFISYFKAKNKYKTAKKIQEEINAAFARNYRLWMLKEDVFADYRPDILVTYSGDRGETFKHPPLLADQSMQSIDKLYSAYPMAGGTLRYYKAYPYFIGGPGNSFYIKSERGTCEITNSIYDRKGRR